MKIWMSLIVIKSLEMIPNLSNFVIMSACPTMSGKNFITYPMLAIPTPFCLNLHIFYACQRFLWLSAFLYLSKLLCVRLFSELNSGYSLVLAVEDASFLPKNSLANRLMLGKANRIEFSLAITTRLSYIYF